ncbi:MAG: LamG-like jellyroll fold domain-containing protein [Limisphaerales bacterium]
MKRKLLNARSLKKAALAVPAAALMLGAAQAGTTVGINFQAWYYNSGNTPQTVGYGAGYQTTGFPVTGTAFSVPAANWFNTDPLSCNGWPDPAPAPIDTSIVMGSLTVNVTAPNCWQSGIGELVAGWHSETVTPGNDEVTWGYLDDGNTTGESPQVSVSGLAAQFPNGYAIQTIAANAGVKTFDGVDITDGTTDSPVDYSTYSYYEANPQSDGYVIGGTIGLSTPSATLTGDTVNINCNPKTAPNRSTLAGFIITDQPVVTRSFPGSTLAAVGGSFVLSASVVGIDTLSYQWQHAGTNIPGATFVNYTNASSVAADSGNYQIIATGSRFPSSPATGAVLVVTVIPTHAARTATWDANTGITGAQDGSGTWSNTLTNWWSGSFDDYWGSADSAVFGMGGTGPYTVTLGDNITANAITFNSGGYTITNSSGQTLTLQSAAGITANAAATITPPLSTGTNTFLKVGIGALTLSGALTCGQTFVEAGTLEVLAKSGDSPYVVTNGATLKIGYSTGSGYANTALQLYGDGTAATTGLYLMGGTIYNVSGQLTLLGAPTTIRQYGTGLAALGIFDINTLGGLDCTSAASGSAVDANIQMVSDGYGMVVTTAAGANNATGDLVINGPLSVGSLGLLTEGTGSVRLNGVATPANLALNVMGGSVICGITNCVGANAALNVGAVPVSSVNPASSATFDLNGFNQTVSNATLAGNLKMTIYTGGTPSGTVLTTTDPSTPLTYGGTLTVAGIGTAPTIGQTFTLFSSAAGYGGAFTNFDLAPFDRLSWDTSQLSVNGSITVIAGSVPPSIVTDLTGATNYAYVGGSCSFVIAASGDPLLHYHWEQNGTTPVGSDSPTLSLISLALASAGSYSVTVTNPYGSAQSQTNYLQVLTPSPYVAAVVQDSPQNLWPLNETVPATAYDYWSGQNGTQNGTLTLGVAGPTPPAYQGFSAGTTAYEFDGASAYIDCGTGPALSGTTDFTLEAWVNTTSTTAGVVIQQRDGGYNGEYGLSVNTNGTLNFYVFGGGAYQFAFGSPAAARIVNDGNWHHIAATRSGLNGAIYIDGSAVATASGSPVAPLDPTISVAIGADVRDDVAYFNGLMCDVAIYNHALSPARITDHATVGVLGAPLTLSLVGRELVWSAGTLVSSPVLGPSAVWNPVSGASSPYRLPPAGSTNSAMFYRLQH